MKFVRSSAAYLISRPATAIIAAGFLFLAGCATTPQPAPEPEQITPAIAPTPAPEPDPVPEPASETKPSAPPVPAEAPPAVPATVEPAPHFAEKMSIRIESNPAGAMIVVDGMPVGRAPLKLEVDAANNGFFKAPVSIRARFVADDSEVESVSIDEHLGPLERVPLALVFSREGVQRILRRY